MASTNLVYQLVNYCYKCKYVNSIQDRTHTMCPIRFLQFVFLLAACWAQEGEWSEDAEDLGMSFFIIKLAFRPGDNFLYKNLFRTISGIKTTYVSTYLFFGII